MHHSRTHKEKLFSLFSQVFKLAPRNVPPKKKAHALAPLVLISLPTLLQVSHFFAEAIMTSVVELVNELSKRHVNKTTILKHNFINF